ncbi:hypothetical protein TESG_06625 [Trichophyton tonsurans CBS 112818]|uniref:Uncharacterized protein n=1 Tax=Trichophyton tonsurans (strain CBS 112818) TaxID=647933 RepID=F2S6I9_TRIT1|nr:hypothetical protein TESG_06625 [Trichophyton tonsurans CBS 112818]
MPNTNHDKASRTTNIWDMQTRIPTGCLSVDSAAFCWIKGVSVTMRWAPQAGWLDASQGTEYTIQGCHCLAAGPKHGEVACRSHRSDVCDLEAGSREAGNACCHRWRAQAHSRSSQGVMRLTIGPVCNSNQDSIDRKLREAAAGHAVRFRGHHARFPLLRNEGTTGCLSHDG